MVYSPSLRIGFDAKRAFQNFTGLGNYSRFVLNALRQYQPQHHYEAYTPKRKASHWSEFPETQIHTAPPNQIPSIWRSWGIKSDLQQNKIQLFHGLSNELPFGISHTKIPSVVTIHDLIFLRFPQLYPWFDRQVYAYKFGRACREATRVVAISEQTKRDIVEFLGISPQKIQVIYQDCDPIFSQEILPESARTVVQNYQIRGPYMLCVATLASRKNQEILIKALPNLPMEISLVLVGGKTPYQQQLELLVGRLGVSERVKFLNKVPTHDLPSLYQQAEVFVYPSVFEGFGIPIVEALHVGVPVVAATGSCLAEAGGPVARYADPHEVDDWVAGIQYFLGNSQARLLARQQGREWVQQFAAERIAHELHNLYLGLV
jgi:glycosyltransferase involved in cell wall biosynthesis